MPRQLSYQRIGPMSSRFNITKATRTVYFISTDSKVTVDKSINITNNQVPLERKVIQNDHSGLTQ